MIYRRLLLFPETGAGTVSKPKDNSGKIKIESNEGRVPDAIKGMTFNAEQLPSLDDGEGHIATEVEVKGKDDGTEKKDEIKTEEVKTEDKTEDKVEKPKGDLKKDEKIEEIEEPNRFLKPPKGSQAEKDALTKKKDQFDFSEFNTQEQDILKKMPKENVPAVMKLIKDSKEFAKAKENQFYQSPQGYLLHPGYNQEVQQINLAEKEARIWSKQLKDVKEGIAIKPLTGWNTKTGEPVYGAEVQASDELEETLRNSMNQCMAIASEKRTAVQNFVNNFPKIVTKEMEGIRAERAKRFAWVADPKLLDHTVSTEGGDKSIRQIRSDIASFFPPYMRNNEAVEACGDLMVALIISKAELAEAKKGQKVTAIKKDEEAAIEPNGDVKPKKTNDSLHGVKTFTLQGAGVEI